MEVLLKHWIFLLGLALLTQSCGSDKKTKKPAPSGNVVPVGSNNSALSLVQGQQLYAKQCEGCHGGITRTTVPAKLTSQMLSGAIKNVAKMNRISQLRSLTNVQMNGISLAVQTATKNKQGGGSKSVLTLQDGQNLYVQNCAACHGSLNQSTKQRKSAQSIKNAIRNVTKMQRQNLEQLSDDELIVIAEALN